MDPLTHTLVGASLSATRLATKTRHATAALVIGANLPDLDVLAYFSGSDAALGFRRGWTHGILALAVLPLALAFFLRFFDRLRAPKGSEARPLSTMWLVGLSYLAVWSHPALDWLNTYGVRWLMPFRETWYYGDSVFIMDPWLWLVLAGGWLIARRRSSALLITWAIISAGLAYTVAGRAPAYLVPIGLVSAGLLLMLVMPPPAESRRHRIALLALVVGAAYVLSMIALHQWTEVRVRHELAALSIRPERELMVGPTPANPLVWEFVARHEADYLTGRFSWTGSERLVVFEPRFRAARPTDHWAAITQSGQSQGFLRWTRFPWLEVDSTPAGPEVHLMDARYARQRTQGFGGTVISLPATP